MKKWFFLIATLSVAGAILLSQNIQALQEFPKSPPVLKLNDPLPSNLFVELARVINPAVVNISTSVRARNQRMGRDPMMELFEQFYGVRPQQPRNNQPQQTSLGTGFIIREDGLIVTNNHVVQGAEIINVQLSEKSQKTYEAVLVGSDQRTDIALIKIKANVKLPVAVLGNSKDVQVGQWVAAFGNPFGHGHTVTKGIISSLGRSIEEINKIPLMQTDASINPGNSGGPLVDSKGLVIGVNSAIDARAQGIGFAIPIDEVKKIIPDLESRGSIRKGYIGIQLGDLDPSAAEYLGLEANVGTVIAGLDRSGPAAQAGLRLYDIVTEFNGKKIKNTTDLMDAVADATIGAKAKLKVIRDRRTVNLEIMVIERPGNPVASKSPAAPNRSEGQKAPFNLGFSVIDLNDQLRQIYGYSSEVKKPVITSVSSSSIAAMAGLQEGDLILDINKVEVTSVKDVMVQLKKNTNTFRIARGARVFVVTITN